jgi:serine phosphatase RsbU (regulator of sigma subunit)
MLMILTRGAFRTAAESMSSPGATLTAMNQALYNDLRKLKSFVTLFCADWDPETEVLTYSNAGHNMPLYINGDNREVSLLPKVKGIMVGGLPNQVYKEEAITLKNNDTVFFYTDGIVEAQNNEGEQYQLERLTNTLKNNQNSDVGEIEKSVIDSVYEFMNGTAQKDDITMVVLKLIYEKSNITSLNSPVIHV